MQTEQKWGRPGNEAEISGAWAILWAGSISNLYHIETVNYMLNYNSVLWKLFILWEQVIYKFYLTGGVQIYSNVHPMKHLESDVV